MKKILIFGKGRIGKAFSFLAQKKGFKVSFFKEKINPKEFDLFFGALPGKVGEISLKFALKYKKDLIDLSDLEPEFYLKEKKKIEKTNISVLPNCGFCPGLLNFLIFYFAQKLKKIEKVEVLAGSLSKKKFFFPFLWCFEDLVLEHEIHSLQLIDGKIKKFKPFANLREEKFFGILAESYFAPSGFEHLMKKIKTKNFVFRIIRPRGFFEFFNFLKNHGFFDKENFEKTKEILESKIEDNFTLGKVEILSKEKRIFFLVQSFSKKKEKLNSMQKITLSFPLEILEKMKERKIKKGLIFPEDLAKGTIANEILENLRKNPLVSFEEKIL